MFKWRLQAESAQDRGFSSRFHTESRDARACRTSALKQREHAISPRGRRVDRTWPDVLRMIDRTSFTGIHVLRVTGVSFVAVAASVYAAETPVKSTQVSGMSARTSCRAFPSFRLRCGPRCPEVEEQRPQFRGRVRRTPRQRRCPRHRTAPWRWADRNSRVTASRPSHRFL